MAISYERGSPVSGSDRMRGADGFDRQQQIYLTEDKSFSSVVWQKSILAQIRQLIIYISNNTG